MYAQIFQYLSIVFVASATVLKWLGVNGDTKKGTPLNIFLSYQLVSGACVVYTTYLGWYGAFYDYGTIYDDHLYGRSETALMLGKVMTGYQAWNIMLCLYINEYRTLQYIAHHVITMMLFSVILHPYLNFYALFYGGIAETTSLPLTVVDNIKFLKFDCPRLLSLSRVVFGVLFYILRIFAWTCVNASCWYETVTNYDRIHSAPVVGLFLLSNIGMTGLQYYWGYLIWKSALKHGPARAT